MTCNWTSDFAVVLLAFLLAFAIIPAPGSALPVQQDTGLSQLEKVSNPSVKNNSAFVSENISIHLTPQTPGEVTITVQYDLNVSNTNRLTVKLPIKSTVRTSQGFQQKPNTTHKSTDVRLRKYEWTKETDTPSITYTFHVNRTQGGGTSFIEFDVGAHAYITHSGWSPALPFVTVNGRDDRSVRRITLHPDGAKLGQHFYLGDASIRHETAYGQQFNVLVPGAANLSNDEIDGLLFTLTGTAREFRVGGRIPTVNVVVLPEKAGRPVSTGFSGGRSMVIGGGFNNQTVVHEYIHLQNPTTYVAMLGGWSFEGVAEYYEDLINYQIGNQNFSTFKRNTKQGEGLYEGVVLTNKSTWKNAASYGKGSLVLGVLDAKIRRATNGNRTLQHVLAAAGSSGELEAALYEVTGRRFESYVYRYIYGKGTPSFDANESLFKRSEHVDLQVRLNQTRIPHGNGTVTIIVENQGFDASITPAVQIRSSRAISIYDIETNAYSTIASDDSNRQWGYQIATGQIKQDRVRAFTWKLLRVLPSGESARLTVHLRTNKSSNLSLTANATDATGNSATVTESVPIAEPNYQVQSVDTQRPLGELLVTTNISNTGSVSGDLYIAIRRSGRPLTTDTFHLPSNTTRSITLEIAIDSETASNLSLVIRETNKDGTIVTQRSLDRPRTPLSTGERSGSEPGIPPFVIVYLLGIGIILLIGGAALKRVT